MSDKEIKKGKKAELRLAKKAAKAQKSEIAKRVREEKINSGRLALKDKAQQRAEKVRRKYKISPELLGSENDSILQIITLVVKSRYIALIVMSAVVFMCTGIFYYADSLSTATAVMMLNYESSAKGMAPNDTRFNISDFTSAEVMTDAIKSAGLEGKVTASELSGNTAVYEMQNRNPSNPQNYYIPTSYKIYFKNPKTANGISADNMLQIIGNSYNKFFHASYTMNPQVLTYDYSTINDLEYSRVSSLFSLRLDEISRYLDMRNAQAGKFKSDETGETFNSIKKLADNLKDYSLADYNAYIWENGIVKNGERYRNTLLYKNDTYGRQRLENMNEYEIRKDVISYFSTAMSTSILIPTANKGEYYMSRTKTGVDHLASDAEWYLETAKNLELDVSKNNDKVSKLHDTANAWQTAKADSMIENIKTELERIEKLAVITDKEYTNSDSKNYITFTTKNISFLKRIPQKKVIVITLLFFAFALFAFCKECRFIIRRGGGNE